AVAPYWYGVPDSVPRYLTYLNGFTPARANVGSRVPLYFRVVDSIGTGVTDAAVLNVKATAISGGGSISGPAASPSFLRVIYLNAKLSSEPGNNVFRIQIANFDPITVTIAGVLPPSGTSTQ